MSIQTDDFAPARRVLSAAPASPNEEAIERALRPKGLQEYVGQAKAREQLEIFIGAARKRGEAMDHVLLFGPPGLGKTTLSHIIAHELGVNLRQTSGPVLEKPKDLAAILTNLEKNDVLFIDEIHRLSPVVEEILYPALERTSTSRPPAGALSCMKAPVAFCSGTVARTHASLTLTWAEAGAQTPTTMIEIASVRSETRFIEKTPSG